MKGLIISFSLLIGQLSDAFTLPKTPYRVSKIPYRMLRLRAADSAADRPLEVAITPVVTQGFIEPSSPVASFLKGCVPRPRRILSAILRSRFVVSVALLFLSTSITPPPAFARGADLAVVRSATRAKKGGVKKSYDLYSDSESKKPIFGKKIIRVLIDRKVRLLNSRFMRLN